MPMRQHFSWMLSKGGFDGEMKVMLFIIHSPVVFNPVVHKYPIPDSPLGPAWPPLPPTWSLASSPLCLQRARVLFCMYCCVFFRYVFLAVSSFVMSCGSMACLGVVVRPNLTLLTNNLLHTGLLITNTSASTLSNNRSQLPTTVLRTTPTTLNYPVRCLKSPLVVRGKTVTSRSYWVNTEYRAIHRSCRHIKQSEWRTQTATTDLIQDVAGHAAQVHNTTRLSNATSPARHIPPGGGGCESTKPAHVTLCLHDQIHPKAGLHG